MGFKERNLTDFEREALFYEKEVLKPPPLYVCGETIVYDYGRYEIFKIDTTPNPPDVPLYDIGHAKTDTMGMVIVDPLRFDRKMSEITEDMIHLTNISQNDCSPASVDDGGLPHHDIKGRGKSKHKKKKKKQHKHHHHHHHHSGIEGEEGEEDMFEEKEEHVMIHEQPEALKRTLLKTNPHFKLQQNLIDKVENSEIILTPRKKSKELKLYQYKDEVIEQMLASGSVTKDDVFSWWIPRNKLQRLNFKPHKNQKK